jgi:glutathione S-transferase
MLFFTGSIPLSSSITEPVSMEDSDPKAPYAVPIVRVTALFHTMSMIYCYIRYMGSGQVGFALGAAGYGGLAGMGLWCILFATSGGKISRRTGADKRTSGFPFKNAEAYNRKRDKKMT